MDVVGAVNDAAYGIPPGTIGDPLAALKGVHAYGIDEASVVVIQDVEDDAFVTFVATLPDRRGERLASAVLAHALHEAERRGQTNNEPPGLQARPVDLRPPRLPRARRDPPL